MLQDYHEPIETIQVPNEVLLPFVIEQIKTGHTVTLPLKGRSMRPFLEDGRDKALLTDVGTPRKGDVVLAEIAPGCYVLHRIISIKGEKVTLRGDGNLNNEHCTIADLRAKAVGFYRKGHQVMNCTDGWKWRIYSWWWTRLYPIRRYLLFIYRLTKKHRI